MNLIVVIGAAVLVAGLVGLLVGVLHRSGSSSHLSVADIQARLAREEDLDTITSRAAGSAPVSLAQSSAAARRARLSRPAVS
ncbi:hypothetical protein ACWEKT_10295 [Nocardia takedensis]|uniref:hypothetical protein n=1 Tax=Nocardia takedensis TaxID=259390 RepID=UPI0002DC2796|nr:hypothetical protein [Nocardia takedensis]